MKATNKQLSKKARKIVAKHGAGRCLKAWRMHLDEGMGANTVACELGLETKAGATATGTADAMILAGEEVEQAAASRTGWSESETTSLCQLYFHMRDLDDQGKLGRGKGCTSKKGLVLAWIEANAPGRSNGSVDAKLMNISASCAALGLPQVKGYKALENRAKALDGIVRAASAALSVLLTVLVAGGAA